MPPPNSSLFLFSFLLIILSIAVQTYSQYTDQNTPFVNMCSRDSFNSSSPYDYSLRDLLDKLITSTPNSPSYFSLINSTSPQIFGLAQCRPDITPAVCTACLNQSAAGFFDNPGCVRKKSFANRAGNCLLRYSDQMFYKVPDVQMFVFYPNEQKAPDSVNQQVNILMSSVMASAATAVLRFATGVNSTGVNSAVDAQEIYGMGWCSMDLASSDCAKCLDSVLGRITAGQSWGNVATVSCHVKFEPYKFYSNQLLLSDPEPEPAGGKKTKKQVTFLIVAIFLPLGLVLVLVTLTFLILTRKRRDRGISRSQGGQTPITRGTDLALQHKIREGNSEFSLMSFSTIMKATGNFSAANKLGQGGFGSVYKGQLPEGESIAVKRLDSCSGQGLEEFMNEIKLIARLQHKNLVKLLGCCVEKDEKLLVYEYMPNNSLEYHLFDIVRKEQLDWPKRFAIIDGIAQGLLYLHKYSRVRIVHRDLKASNILLDPEMNPKISDFGMARIFDVNTTQANTNRIVGTYGYMSPEYAMEGLFSIKSDVFSFGVLMLEIISGKRNTIFHKSGKALNLLAHAWELWKNGSWLDFVDPSLGDKILINDLLKCIIIALMCVQEHVIDRPIMSEIIAMLGSENIALPDPKKPAFFIGRANESVLEISSQNDITLTVLEGR